MAEMEQTIRKNRKNNKQDTEAARFNGRRHLDKVIPVRISTERWNQIKKEAVVQRMITLRQDGIEKIIRGMTTLEEVLRVTES